MVTVCQSLGVSVAAIALMLKLDANLLRRWLEKARSGATTTGGDVMAMKPLAAAPMAPAFVPLQLSDANDHQREIRIEVRRSRQSITVSWPILDAAQCAAWLRERLK
jgi:transposase